PFGYQDNNNNDIIEDKLILLQLFKDI
ncbi:MAG: hypothetical protein ACI90V_006849, partial [Bacillariaceae sp.]